MDMTKRYGAKVSHCHIRAKMSNNSVSPCEASTFAFVFFKASLRYPSDKVKFRIVKGGLTGKTTPKMVPKNCLSYFVLGLILSGDIKYVKNAFSAINL